MRTPLRTLLLPILLLPILLLPILLLPTQLLAEEDWNLDDEDVRRHGIFVDTLDVSLINVEVMATKDGQPVIDLGPEDFEIFDDGKPAEITNFQRVEEGLRVLAPAEDGDAEPVGADPALPAKVEQREKAFVVVMVDQAFIGPSSRARVFGELREHLDELMTRGTQVMVVSKNREMRLVRRPTSDRAEIESALDELAKVSPRSFDTRVRMTIRQIERGMTKQDLEPLARNDVIEGEAQHTYGLARALSQEVSHEVTHSLRILSGFVASLAGLPGRKAVLYVCDRLPLRPGELAWDAWYRKYGEDYADLYNVNSVDSVTREFDTSLQVKDLIADATASRISFYPVGAGPAQGLSAISAENATSTITSGGLSTYTDDGGGLRMLANETGGQVATGSGSSAWLFKRMSQDIGHYYSLAYASPHRGDGEKHRIKVRCLRPGVKLNYIESYRDKSSYQQMQEQTLASLLLDNPTNPMDVRVIPGAAEKQKDGTFLMDMEVRFPIAKLLLLPEETQHSGRVTIVLIVRDNKGRLSDPVRVLVPINVPHEGILEALTQTAVYNTKLAIRGGEQTVAVGVHDDLGQSSSTVNVSVDVGGSRG